MKVIKSAPWDSKFLGLKVGQIELPECTKYWALSNDHGENLASSPVYELLYVKGGHSALKIDGYRATLFEKRIVYIKNLQEESINKYPALGPNNSIDSMKTISYSLDELYTLAYVSGQYSRFKRDSNFGLSKFRQLYRLWVDNAINGSFAEDVILYKRQEVIVGMITYRLLHNKATIGLFGVSPHSQGQGIGSALLATLEQWLFRQRITYLEIPTQKENSLACSFYAKLGYLMDKEQNLHHFWKL